MSTRSPPCARRGGAEGKAAAAEAEKGGLTPTSDAITGASNAMKVLFVTVDTGSAVSF